MTLSSKVVILQKSNTSPSRTVQRLIGAFDRHWGRLNDRRKGSRARTRIDSRTSPFCSCFAQTSSFAIDYPNSHISRQLGGCISGFSTKAIFCSHYHSLHQKPQRLSIVSKSRCSKVPIAIRCLETGYPYKLPMEIDTL